MIGSNPAPATCFDSSESRLPQGYTKGRRPETSVYPCDIVYWLWLPIAYKQALWFRRSQSDRESLRRRWQRNPASDPCKSSDSCCRFLPSPLTPAACLSFTLGNSRVEFDRFAGRKQHGHGMENWGYPIFFTEAFSISQATPMSNDIFAHVYLALATPAKANGDFGSGEQQRIGQDSLNRLENATFGQQH